MTHLLVLGDLNADVLLSIPYYPSPGGDIVTDSYAVQAGGSAANTACALARLGLDVSLIARVGKDSWGELVRAAVEQAGVRADLIQQDPAAPTGLAFVPVLPGGERTLFCARGANEATDPSAILPECFAGIDWLHLSGYALLHAPQQQAASRALELARERWIPVSLDTALEPARLARDEMRWLLPQLALVVLGRAEAHALTGKHNPEEAATALLSSGVGCLGLKLGGQGCMVADARGIYHQPLLPVRAIDGTGAGDAFTAGLIVACRAGLSLPASALLASALGALATTVRGAGPALRSRADLVTYLESLPLQSESAEYLDEALAALA